MAAGTTDERSRWAIWTGAMRPRTLPAAVAPVLVGSALAWHDRVFDPVAALICLAFALLIQIGTNFANDYYDFVKGADTPRRVGPVRAVAAGLVAPAVMRRAMVLVLSAAFLLGLTLIAWGGPWLIAVGAASVLCAIAYTGGPYPLGYHGLGDVFVFLFFGLIAVGATYFVQAGRVSAEALLFAVPVGLLATNILLVNNYRDVATDRLAGKHTLVVRFGERFAQGQFTLSLLVALAVPAYYWLRGEGIGMLLPCLLAPMAWRHARRLRQSKTPGELIRLLGDTGRLLALYALLLAAGLTVGRL
jgi:1,4-dihydroxy-2-naphthoate octaprenyltransferase